MNKSISELQPHPTNKEIYGDQADTELVESVRTKGVLNPLLVTNDGIVISGHRRLDAARRAGLKEVPTVLFRSDDNLDVLEALIESNRQRQKTNEQFGREAKVLLDIERERAHLRRLATQKYNNSIDQEHVPGLLVDTGQAREKVGQQLGTSGKHAEHAAQVVTVIDDLNNNGHQQEAEQLRTTLNNGSVRKAYNTARMYTSLKSTEPEPLGYITLEQWKSFDTNAQKECIDNAPRGSANGFNKQENDSIEWARWSWNPITGCETGCSYCYARDIANRFYPQGFTPTFYPDRLAAPHNNRVPSLASGDIGYKNIFTCSMADMFGPWVPTEWIRAVLDEIRAAPQWNFLMLTKWPERMQNFSYPDNAWVGATVDKQTRVATVEETFQKIEAPVKFVSCEPLLEPLEFSELHIFDWVIIGGQSGTTQESEFHPPRSWVNDLEEQARNVGCKIYEKSNLLERIRDYPNNG